MVEIKSYFFWLLLHVQFSIQLGVGSDLTPPPNNPRESDLTPHPIFHIKSVRKPLYSLSLFFLLNRSLSLSVIVCLPKLGKMVASLFHLLSLCVISLGFFTVALLVILPLWTALIHCHKYIYIYMCVWQFYCDLINLNYLFSCISFI